VRQAGVDRSRIALFGRSFAGYLALRGATGEQRLAALVLDPAQYDFSARLARMLGADLFGRITSHDPTADADLETQFKPGSSAHDDLMARAVAHGAARPAAYFRELARFTARGQLERISCPVLVMDADDDFTSDGQADEVHAGLTGPRTRHHLTREEGAGGHCGGLGQQRVHQIVFDWLDDILPYPAR
jgi:pimeloyl-ACP methyl ester carboxylesterase